jgi:hypothetical protein
MTTKKKTKYAVQRSALREASGTGVTWNLEGEMPVVRGVGGLQIGRHSLTAVYSTSRVLDRALKRLADK